MSDLSAQTRWMDATGQAELVRSGQVTALELIEAAIERIEAADPWINAVVMRWFDQARRTAVGVLPAGTFRGVPGEPPALLGTLPGDPVGQSAYTAFTRPFNITGQPAISLPLNWNSTGLPIGIQLVAAYGREDLLINVAAQIEQARPWADRKPPEQATFTAGLPGAADPAQGQRRADADGNCPHLSLVCLAMDDAREYDWKHLLAEQLDWWWRFHLRPRMDGLTDEEYHWEPVPGMWGVRPRGTSTAPVAVGSGDFTADFAFPQPDPPPATTIAWRMMHLVIGCFGMRAASHFGGPAVEYDTYDYPGDAATALERLDASYALWIDGVRALGPEELMRPIGPAEGPFAKEPMAALVVHINREALHHGAEIALLRDLYWWKENRLDGRGQPGRP